MIVPRIILTTMTRLHERENLYGEYLVYAKIEDVVAGIRTPQPDQSRTFSRWHYDTLLEEVMPDVSFKLDRVRSVLKRIIVICRIWNLRFSEISFTLCCKPAMVSALKPKRRSNICN